MESRFILFLILLCGSAFFSSAETALFSLSRVQIHKFNQSKKRSAQAVVNCLRHPRRWLATILLGNELINVSISIIGASIVNYYFNYTIKVQMLIAIAIVTPLVLVFGEIIPKNLAIRFASHIAPVSIVPLGLFHKLVLPFRLILTKIADGMVILFGGQPDKLQPMVMEEEFRHLVDLGKKEGVIVEEEREMIHKVFDFSDKTIASIITPLESIFALPLNKPYDEMLGKIKSEDYSRVPIYEGELSNIIGILHVHDLFNYHRQKQTGEKQSLRSFLRKPLFVSPEKKLENLLRDFQRERIHMAIVKRGKQVIGLVTMDDLLEEIFGEIEK